MNTRSQQRGTRRKSSQGKDREVDFYLDPLQKQVQGKATRTDVV